ncbi:MAG: hypothetical protein ACYCU0_13780 [Solirubrobacteraceae bacterium]
MIDGEFEMRIGERQVTVRPGETVHVPVALCIAAATAARATVGVCSCSALPASSPS